MIDSIIKQIEDKNGKKMIASVIEKYHKYHEKLQKQKADDDQTVLLMDEDKYYEIRVIDNKDDFIKKNIKKLITGDVVMAVNNNGIIIVGEEPNGYGETTSSLLGIGSILGMIVSLFLIGAGREYFFNSMSYLLIIFGENYWKIFFTFLILFFILTGIYLHKNGKGKILAALSIVIGSFVYLGGLNVLADLPSSPISYTGRCYIYSEKQPKKYRNKSLVRENYNYWILLRDSGIYKLNYSSDRNEFDLNNIFSYFDTKIKITRNQYNDMETRNQNGYFGLCMKEIEIKYLPKSSRLVTLKLSELDQTSDINRLQQELQRALMQ